MGKLIELVVTGRGMKRAHTFHTFPIRIGRDPTYECQLGYAFVSRHHARLELRDGDIFLVDEGSALGTFAGTTQVERPVSIDEIGGEFRIGEFLFRVTVLADTPNDEELDAGNETLARGDETRTYAHARVDPADVDESGILQQVRETLRANRTLVRDAVLEALSALESKRGREMLVDLARDFPEVRETPEIASVLSEIGGASHDEKAKVAALEGLEALLRSYRVGDVHLASEEDVSRALVAVRMALTGLASGMSTLFRAYAHEARDSEVEIDDRHLLAFLLEPDQSERAGRAIQDVFDILASHHAQLAREVMNGVRVLLAELSPAATWVPGWGPWQWRSRWEAYCRRYGELAVLDEGTVARLFGPTLQRLFALSAPDRTTEMSSVPASRRPLCAVDPN